MIFGIKAALDYIPDGGHHHSNGGEFVNGYSKLKLKWKFIGAL